MVNIKIIEELRKINSIKLIFPLIVIWLFVVSMAGIVFGPLSYDEYVILDKQYLSNNISDCNQCLTIDTYKSSLKVKENDSLSGSTHDYKTFYFKNEHTLNSDWNEFDRLKITWKSIGTNRYVIRGVEKIT